MLSVVCEMEIGRSAAFGTPTDLLIRMDIDREVVRALLDAATDAALENNKGIGMLLTMGSSACAVTDPSQSAAIHAT